MLSLRSDSLARNLALALAATLFAAACGDAAPPPAPPALTAQQVQQLAYTKQVQARFLHDLFGDGVTPAEPCRASAPESIRLLFVDAHWQRAFSVVVGTNQGGGLAVWDQVLRDPKSGAYALGHRQGMQLDVNGWRQVRQAVTDARFRQLAPGAYAGAPPRFGSTGGVWSIESCVAGTYSITVRDLPYAQQDEDFARAARTIVRLAGSVYTFGEYVGP